MPKMSDSVLVRALQQIIFEDILFSQTEGVLNLKTTTIIYSDPGNK
jgi:hypothetical protein